MEVNSARQYMASGTVTKTDKKIEYHTLVARSLSTTGTNVIDTYSGRKISDYDMIFVNVGYANTRSRGTYIIPTTLFKSGQVLYVTYIYGGVLKEVDITYVSDTKISISNSEAIEHDSVNVYGLAVK